MKLKGFGGIFWRTKDMPTLKSWYKETLGISMEDWNGTVIQPSSGNQTIFSFFKEDSTYFPTEQAVMLNFQVENIAAWMEHFKQLGVPLLKEPEVSEYGTFIWISDPEGRWIEIWEN
ncbi:VOC family protein [Bacillus wiedmannii]|uniref:VOC family protein n=1 Tax=Bacillus wiedmannii TaxID=1890302 RepID=UPI000BEFEF3E|nr:VOC family protein [Bacillus wiedmannii]PEO40902.1 glyoxalase [Bacillus wiedmannii]